MTSITDEFEKSSKSPHDTAFRLVFRKKELAGSFFRHYLPENIAGHIDFSTLKTVNKSFVDKNFRQVHSDMVYEIRLKGKTAFFYLLFEHQSSPDRRMPFRMLCYMVNLWKDFEAGHPKVHHLPVIFPAVLYHGKQKWNSPLNLREMIDGYEKDFEWFIPDFAYRLFDLSQYDDESIVSAGNKALAVVLHLFKHIFDEIFGNVFRGTADRVIEIDDQKMFSEILEWAVTYFLHARNEDADELIDVISQQAEKFGDERIRRVVMTAAEQLRQKGIKQGIEQGIEKGIEQGIEKGIEQGIGIGRSALILKLLKKRFGRLPPAIEQKLNESRVEVLDRFGESIFDFKDLKDAEKWWDDYETGGNA